MEVNTEALNVAKAALTPEQQQRFSKFGYQVQVFPDKSYSTGFTWYGFPHFNLKKKTQTTH